MPRTYVFKRSTAFFVPDPKAALRLRTQCKDTIENITGGLDSQCKCTHCIVLSWCGWHSAFPMKENPGVAESTKYHPCSLTACQKVLPKIFCKHLEGMCHGCEMTQMSWLKYHWILNCSRVRSLAHPLHMAAERKILGHRICGPLTWNTCGCWSNCFCWDSQFKMDQPSFKVTVEVFCTVVHSSNDAVSLPGKK